MLDTTGAALIEAERLAWLEGQRWWEAEAQRIAEPLRESILALMTARKGAGDSDPFAGVFRALDISGATPLPEPPAGAPSMYRRRLSVKGWQR